jgi:hypothetical protein
MLFLPSVTRSDEVVAQLFYRCRGLAGLYGLGVVCDEEGLLGLDDYDAFFALCVYVSFISSISDPCSAHLLAV